MGEGGAAAPKRKHHLIFERSLTCRSQIKVWLSRFVCLRVHSCRPRDISDLISFVQFLWNLRSPGYKLVAPGLDGYLPTHPFCSFLYGRGPRKKETPKRERREQRRRRRRDEKEEGGRYYCAGNKKKTRKLCPLVKMLENNNIVPPPCWERE